MSIISLQVHRDLNRLIARCNRMATLALASTIASLFAAIFPLPPLVQAVTYTWTLLTWISSATLTRKLTLDIATAQRMGKTVLGGKCVALLWHGHITDVYG